MKKMMFMLALAALLMMTTGALADRFYEDFMSLPNDSGDQAKAAAQAHLPQAMIDYALLDYDDQRFEWEVYFSYDGTLGVCEVDAKTGEVFRTRTYSDLAAGALTADKAIEALGKAKGNVTVLELDLERDDGRLVYEGEAELDGRFYDFEMTIEGRIIEWERD